MIRTLRQSAKKRLKRRLRNYRHAYGEGKIELEAISQSVASYKGHLKHAHTYRLQKNIWKHFILRRKHPEEDRVKNKFFTLQVCARTPKLV